MARIAKLIQQQLATIDWVLKSYRDAQDSGDTQAIAEVAANLDGWLRSVLEIVKTQAGQIEWLEHAIESWKREEELWRKQEKELYEALKEYKTEMDAIHYAAHMPKDYEHGLASWINQHLYGELIMLRDAEGRPIRRSEDIAEMLRLRATLKITWIPCEERRMPDTSRDVWVFPFLDTEDKCAAPIAFWSSGKWWADNQPLENPGITHWAEIRWPEPPQTKEGGNV